MREDVEYQEQIVKLVGRWELLGRRNFSDGTVAIGHVQDIGTEAYLHRLYGPLRHDEVEYLEHSIERPMPPPLRLLYQKWNGMNFFMSKLCVYGLVRSTDRANIEAMHCRPYDLRQLCLWSRPDFLDEGAVVFAEYEEDDSKVYMYPSSQYVYRCSKSNAKELIGSWPSLGAWLIDEVTRIGRGFDAYGKELHHGDSLLLP